MNRVRPVTLSELLRKDRPRACSKNSGEFFTFIAIRAIKVVRKRGRGVESVLDHRDYRTSWRYTNGRMRADSVGVGHWKDCRVVITDYGSACVSPLPVGTNGKRREDEVGQERTRATKDDEWEPQLRWRLRRAVTPMAYFTSTAFALEYFVAYNILAFTLLSKVLASDWPPTTSNTCLSAPPRESPVPINSATGPYSVSWPRLAVVMLYILCDLTSPYLWLVVTSTSDSYTSRRACAYSRPCSGTMEANFNHGTNACHLALYRTTRSLWALHSRVVTLLIISSMLSVTRPINSRLVKHEWIPIHYNIKMFDSQSGHIAAVYGFRYLRVLAVRFNKSFSSRVC
ncbi:hypothetical protein J6590_000211 [Homalodisca vitripennis]|nr:hypothetical protein J6590_000211 [Homalodisca vitripennis]